MGCQQCTDDPWLNLSSEDPDRDRFFKIFFYKEPPPLGWEFRAVACMKICVSEVSQEEADDCARVLAQECLFNYWRPPPNGDIFPQLFTNSRQTCTIRCSDGAESAPGTNTFTWSVAPGTIIALSQSLADTYAHSLACSRAREHRICIDSQLAGGCVDQPYDQQIIANGGVPALFPFSNFDVPAGCNQDVDAGDRSNFSPIPYTFSITSGSLPPGLELRPCTGHIKGTPTAAGIYSFTVQVVDSVGSFQVRSLTLAISEIDTEDPLPGFIIGEPYTQNLTVSPIHDQESETWSVIAGDLPPGIELTSAGILTGTPEGPLAGYAFTVQVTFLPSGSTTYLQCTKEFHISNSLLVGYWKLDEASQPRINSVSPGMGDLITLFPFPDPPNASGLISNAVNFLSTNSYFINTGDISEFAYNQTDVVVAGWVKLVAANNDRLFIGSFEATDGANNWFMTFHWNHPTGPITNRFVARFKQTGFATHTVEASDVLPVAGAWVFFKMWIDTSTMVLGLQINQQTKFTTAIETPIATPVGNFILANNSVATANFLVDETGLWFKALTDAETNSLYNSGSGNTFPNVPM